MKELSTFKNKLNLESREKICDNDGKREECGYYGIKEDECVNTNKCCWNAKEGDKYCFKKNKDKEPEKNDDDAGAGEGDGGGKSGPTSL